MSSAPIPATTAKPQYTGTLRRAPDGTYTGTIVDAWGWPINLTAHVEEDAAGKFFALTGETGEVPACLRVSVVDDPQGVEG